MKTKYDIARQRVKKKSEFRAHAVSYLVCCLFLLGINLWTSPNYLWAVWPALGWGIGVAFHGFSAYGVIPDKADEEVMIEKELHRMEYKEQESYREEKDRLDLREMPKEPRYNEDDFV